MKLRVEPGIDGTRVYAPRPDTGRLGRGVFNLGLLALGWGVVLLSGVPLFEHPALFPLSMASFIAGAVLLLIGVVIRARHPISNEYEILLDPTGITIDGERMAHDVTMLLHEQKLVFRDSDRMIEVWHGISDLDERMRLRDVLEQALRAAQERHGDGSSHVPESLRRPQGSRQ